MKRVPVDAASAPEPPLVVHLVDGTYELFRHFFGQRRFNKGEDLPLAAVAGVLQTVLEFFERGETYVAVATDHVIESFRNELWPGYKTGDGIEPALKAQFHPLEDALRTMGVVVWPMVDLEADDALASGAHLAASDARVQKVCIWTPDKDLAQCVDGTRVVQVDRKGKTIRDAAGVRAKFGVDPKLIPDYLALVGDAQDGYPGIAGIGAVGAARLLNRHGPIESFAAEVLGDRKEQALLFKRLATLRRDAALFDDVEQLAWRGVSTGFEDWCRRLSAPRLLERAAAAESASRLSLHLSLHSTMAYNKAQWIESFEGQLSILRPHLTERVLASMSIAAWHQFGTAGEEPINVARELSKLLDARAKGLPKSSPN